MNIGVPKERKRDETRVALRPDQVPVLFKQGHKVFVETGAGEKAGFEDASYEQAGAHIVNHTELYDKASLIVKVKCPLESEYKLYGHDHVLFTYLHFDENIKATNIQQIVGTGVTGVAYEWVKKNRHLPLLEPMSELTGAVFARKSMSLLMEHKGLLGGRYLPHWPTAQVMVIGAGHIGCNAINVFAQNCFRVIVVDKHPETLERRLGQYIASEVRAQVEMEVVRFDEASPVGSTAAIREYLPSTDIVIVAAVRRSTLPKEKCEYLIRREDVADMSKNSVLCDATACDCDFVETCVSSESLTETYIEEGVIHYNCDHVPAMVANTATILLTNATFPYVLALAEGFENAVKRNIGLREAVTCYRGCLTHKIAAVKKNLPCTSLKSLLDK